jgi:Xaa-Pro aminopeptidase
VRRMVAAGVVATLLLSASALAVQLPPFGGAPAFVADLGARRSAVMTSLGGDTALVLWSAPPRVYSTDTNYEYRQESNLLYLTGIDEESCTLVLVPGGALLPSVNGGPREIATEVMFVRAADPFRELWDGHVPSPAEIAARSGIRHVFPQRGTEAFDGFMASLFATAAEVQQGEGFRQMLAAGRGRLMILDRIPASEASETRQTMLDPDVVAHLDWARAVKARFPQMKLESAASMLGRQRAIKTVYEQALLRRGVEISSEAHIAGMRAAKPGRWEYEVEAAIEHEWHRQGALSWGYPSIVASGPNATTLHYEKSTRQMEAGDLLLVDAAGNYQGLTGDITRTYPVSGKFSREQRTLYDLVLRAVDAGIAAAKPGGRASDISHAVNAVLGPGLLELGLVTDPQAATGDSPQILWWAPHSPTHGIGIDVHDPLEALDPGAAFVVEPGVYIRADVLERLMASPTTRATAEQIRPAVQRFLNMGIRIEDSLLMTPHGPENLSVRVPRRAEDIEKTVGKGP